MSGFDLSFLYMMFTMLTAWVLMGYFFLSNQRKFTQNAVVAVVFAGSLFWPLTVFYFLCCGLLYILNGFRDLYQMTK